MGDLHRTDTPKSSTGAVKPSTTDEARLKADLTAQEAQNRTDHVALEARAKTDATALEAQGKTAATVNNADDKLESFKDDLLAGKHRPHSHAQQNPAAHGQEQGAFLRTVGVPQEAGTAPDAPGTGSTNVRPTDDSAGVTGPVAPTGQGGLLASTGAEASSAGPNNELSGTRKAAFNAADKAQEALNNAKDKLFGGPKA